MQDSNPGGWSAKVKHVNRCNSGPCWLLKLFFQENVNDIFFLSFYFRDTIQHIKIIRDSIPNNQYMVLIRFKDQVSWFLTLIYCYIICFFWTKLLQIDSFNCTVCVMYWDNKLDDCWLFVPLLSALWIAFIRQELG